MLVQITDSAGGAVPTAGEEYDLVCSVLGAENLKPTITYQWTKNSDMLQSIGTSSNTPSFTPIRVSDAGTNYSCLVTIASSYLTGNIIAMTSYMVRIQSELKWRNYNILLLKLLHVCMWRPCSSKSIFYHIVK